MKLPVAPPVTLPPAAVLGIDAEAPLKHLRLGRERRAVRTVLGIDAEAPLKLRATPHNWGPSHPVLGIDAEAR